MKLIIIITRLVLVALGILYIVMIFGCSPGKTLFTQQQQLTLIKAVPLSSSRASLTLLNKFNDTVYFDYGYYGKRIKWNRLIGSKWTLKYNADKPGLGKLTLNN